MSTVLANPAEMIAHALPASYTMIENWKCMLMLFSD